MMAFSFVKYKTPATKPDGGGGCKPSEQISPKLPSSQLNKSSKLYPSWLRDDAANLKQLPGIYQGVLGQVQLQSELLTESAINNNNISAIRLVSSNKRSNPSEYMNSFTDTERVKQLLSMSRLSNEILATIWAHVNKTFPGRLTNREVCLALALIALFQKSDSESDDQFNQIKLEKKPPVPILYPSQCEISPSPVPNELYATNNLLIDFNECPTDEGRKSVEQQTTGQAGNYSLFGSIDAEIILQQSQIWSRTVTCMRNVFKRAFDILNVENSRQSALEALVSIEGEQFCKNLCLCYPIAHNITYKVNELEKKHLIGVNYTKTINDLMLSINEYWAVLINLFHESGQTDFIELIMDGLNKTNETVSSNTREELAIELDSVNKADLCSICHTKFYLVNIGDALEKRELSEEDLTVVLSQETLTNDGRYYYHAKCANFWLNNVDRSTGLLPYSERDVLKPIGRSTG